MPVSFFHSTWITLLHFCNSDGPGCYVLHPLYMPRCNTVISIESRTSYGPYLLDHPGLAGVAGFAGGQDAAPSILEVHADLIGV